jgi:hypothetical protein
MDRRDDPWWVKKVKDMDLTGALAQAGQAADAWLQRGARHGKGVPDWWWDMLIEKGLDRHYGDIKGPMAGRMPDYGPMIEKAFGPTRSTVAKRAVGSVARQVARRLPLATALMQTAELGGSTPQDRMRQQWYDKFKQREGVAGAPAKFNPGPFRPPWK